MTTPCHNFHHSVTAFTTEHTEHAERTRVIIPCCCLSCMFVAALPATG